MDDREDLDISTGDVVRLRSGGPPMTVEDVDIDTGKVGAHWFRADGQRCFYEFRPQMLVVVDEES